MKRFIYFFIVVSIFSSFGFSNQSMDAPPKVLEVFSQTFKNTRDVKWLSNGDEFTAVFFNNDIRTVITYDKNANFLFSKRYYRANNLPLNVLLKINEKFKEKTIENVTEVIEGDTILYSVTVEDEKKLYVIESDGNANIKLQLKLKKK